MAMAHHWRLLSFSIFFIITEIKQPLILFHSPHEFLILSASDPRVPALRRQARADSGLGGCQNGSEFAPHLCYVSSLHFIHASFWLGDPSPATHGSLFLLCSANLCVLLWNDNAENGLLLPLCFFVFVVFVVFFFFFFSLAGALLEMPLCADAERLGERRAWQQVRVAYGAVFKAAAAALCLRPGPADLYIYNFLFWQGGAEKRSKSTRALLFFFFFFFFKVWLFFFFFLKKKP
jgi:hypothetical protein